MTKLLYIPLFFFFCSCTTLRKSKSSEQKAVDSTAFTVVDTTHTVKVDSIAGKEESKESWWQKDTATTSEQTTITETITEISYDTSGHKKSEKKTERKTDTQRQAIAKTEAGKAVELAVAHTGISTEDVKKGEATVLTKLVKSEQATIKQKTTSMFPIWLFLLLIAGVVYWLWRRYHSFKLPF